MPFNLNSMQINRFIAATTLFTVLLVSDCSRGDDAFVSEDSMTNEIMSVSLTKRQMRNFNIQTVQLSKQLVERNIECTGLIEVPLSNCARVTAPLGGIVKRLYVKNETYVKAGNLLAVVEHPDYLKIQQDYLEKKSLLYFYHEEFTRQGELTVENASSIKRMQQAEVNYRTTEVSFLALKEQLEMLGINADSLRIENISPEIRITAPISGYVSEIGSIPGAYIYPSASICEIVNPENLYLNLQVPEQHAFRIKSGQPVWFTIPGDTLIWSGARTELTAKQIDPAKKTLNVTAKMHDHILLPFPGTTIYATIQTDSDSAYMIPTKAVVSKVTKEYVFIFHDGIITRIPVVTGTVINDMTELKNLEKDLYNRAYIISETDMLNSLFQVR